MNESQFNLSIDSLRKVLDYIQFLKGDRFDINIKRDLRKNKKNTTEYLDLYSEIINRGDFDFLLLDESIIQIRYWSDSGTKKARYVFYKVPFDYFSYEEFLVECGFDNEKVGGEFMEEYEQALSERDIIFPFVHTRYDYIERDYCEGIHPVSHFHVGNQPIRVSARSLITPYMFAFVVLKQFYYAEWKKWIKDKKFRDYYNFSKRSCEEVGENFWKDLDERELFLV